MKQLLILASIFFSITVSYAQEKKPVQVPAEVTASLKKMFPDAAGVEWSQKKEKYKGEFKLGKTKHEVWLDKAGKVSRHRYEIKKDALPKAVTDAIAAAFSTYTVDDCERTDNDGVATYKVELKSDAGKKKVNFSADGKVIPKNDE